MLVLQLSLIPVTVNAAGETTLEVYSGRTIYIEQERLVTATQSDGIPVTVRNVPEYDEPENGLHILGFDLVWDPQVVQVVNIVITDEAREYFAIFDCQIDNVMGKAVCGGYRIPAPYQYWNEMTVAYIGIAAVGKPGDATLLQIIPQFFKDKYMVPIPVTALSSTITILDAGEDYLVITPENPVMTVNSTLQFTAKIVDSEGEKKDVTAETKWSLSSDELARIQWIGNGKRAVPGLLTSLFFEGEVTVYAEYDEMKSSTLLMITPEEKEEDEPEETIDEEPEDIPEIEEPDTGTSPEPEATAENTTPVEETVTETEPSDDVPAETVEEIDEVIPENTTEETEDDSSNSGLPLPWIIGGVVVFAGIIGTLAYTLFIRGRY